MTHSTRSKAVEIAEEYYDTPGEDIATASRRTVETMAEQLGDLTADSRVIDLGSGYGGAARYLAANFDCHVDCLNLSRTQNELNRKNSKEAGVTALIDVIHGSYENIPAPDATYDVAWSQDAILHSGDRPRVLDEIERVLKPGGQVIFTDPMQADDCPDGVLQPILDRIHLGSLASFEFYRSELSARGFEEVAVSRMLDQLRTHYARVGEDLQSRYDDIVALSGKEYVDNMLNGLQHWVNGADKRHLAWGIVHFQKAA